MHLVCTLLIIGLGLRPKGSATGARSLKAFGTLGLKDLLHPLLTTLGTFEVSGPCSRTFQVGGTQKGGFQKGGFQKGGFGGCPPGTKTGTRVRSDVPPERKTGTRVRSHVPPERKPERGYVRQNHPFIRAPQKGPEKWCRAKIVEKFRNTF